MLKEIEKDNIEKVQKYSSITNIFIEHYNKKRSYEMKELEEDNLFNKKYLIKKNKLKKPNLLNSEFFRNKDKLDFYFPSNSLKKKILNTKLNKNNSSNSQLSIIKNSKFVSFENLKNKSLKSRQISQKIFNYNPIMNNSINLKKLKIKYSIEKQNDFSKKDKLHLFNRNTKLQKIKIHRLNKSSMIIRPINFFSKKDLIY